MENPQWLTTMCEHDGQSLAIRFRPLSAVKDVCDKYGHLFVVTHRLALVRSDGMPTPDYNESLFHFDCELIKQLENGGRVVLVETYAGERIYYAYVADKNASEILATMVLSTYDHLSESSFRGGPDPTWRFYFRYMDEMF